KTDVEMKEKQLQSEEETSGELLRDLERKKHTIGELKSELKRMRAKNSSLREHIKKHSQGQPGHALAFGSAKGSSVELTEEDRKSSQSSLRYNNKTSRKYQMIQQSNKLLRDENTSLKSKLSEMEALMKLNNKLGKTEPSYSAVQSSSPPLDDTGKEAEDIVSMWKIRQCKLNENIDSLQKKVDSLENQKLTLNITNQRLKQEHGTEQELNKMISGHVKRAQANVEMLQTIASQIREKCAVLAAPHLPALARYFERLDSEILALQTNLTNAMSEKSKGTNSRRCNKKKKQK
ncbi:hypothetical protein RFI_16781, partial [Reticulomyxa filosa]